jgi:hypothetical protein
LRLRFRLHLEWVPVPAEECGGPSGLGGHQHKPVAEPLGGGEIPVGRLADQGPGAVRPAGAPGRTVHQAEGVDVLRDTVRLDHDPQVAVHVLVPVIQDQVGPGLCQTVQRHLVGGSCAGLFDHRISPDRE